MAVRLITARTFATWYEEAEEKFVDDEGRRFFRVEDDLWMFCLKPRQRNYPDVDDVIYVSTRAKYTVKDATINNFGPEQKTKSVLVGQVNLTVVI